MQVRWKSRAQKVPLCTTLHNTAAAAKTPRCSTFVFCTDQTKVAVWCGATEVQLSQPAQIAMKGLQRGTSSFIFSSDRLGPLILKTTQICICLVSTFEFKMCSNILCILGIMRMHFWLYRPVVTLIS